MSDRLLTRRLTSLFAVLALVGTPALVLRMFCVGKSCEQSDASTASVPFCPLPADVRGAVAAGFRAGRSPDVMATTAGLPVVEPPHQGSAPWPSSDPPDLRVPIAFLGSRIARGSLPDGMGLDQIAPTLAQVIGYARAHPEVRAGTAVALGDGASERAATPLVVEIAWAGVGTRDLASEWPRRTARMIRAGGAGTLLGTTGSLPLDPTATLTTMGTGGLPFQHGITGSQIRDERGGVVAPWTDGAPTSVISTLADDLRHSFGARSRVGIVEGRRTDRGLVGNGWYLGAPPSDVVTAANDPLPGVLRLLRRGYGSPDGAPDVMGVVLRGPIELVDTRTAAIVSAVRDRVPEALIAIAGTGGEGRAAATPSDRIARRVDAALGARVVSGSAAGGFFLNTRALDAADLTADAVVQQMRALTHEGQPQFSQVYPSFAVAFARYC